MGAMSHWLVQGFPHPFAIGISPELASTFPCPLRLVDVKTGLDGKAQKVLMGNAMHVAAVGSWLLYNMACVDRDSFQQP